MLQVTDSALRKATPIFAGCIAYFPLALAAIARLSKLGNDKHNPGQPLHWSRDKSNDHPDCVARHLMDYDQIDPETGEYHAVAMLWRAAAIVQLLEEKRLMTPCGCTDYGGPCEAHKKHVCKRHDPDCGTR